MTKNSIKKEMKKYQDLKLKTQELLNYISNDNLPIPLSDNMKAISIETHLQMISLCQKCIEQLESTLDDL